MDKQKMIGDKWWYVLSLLPKNLEKSAKETLAFLRSREVKCAADLLRLVLAYGVCDKSFEEVSLWAKQAKVCTISDVGVLKRLRYCPDWLRRIISDMLAEGGVRADVGLSRRVRIVDATYENRPGRKGTDWRLHFGYDLGRMSIDEVILTGPRQGETLSNFHVKEGEILIADRGYAHRRGICDVVRAGGDVIARINWQNLPLIDGEGRDIDIVSLVATLGPGQVGDWEVWTKPDEASHIESVHGRLVAVRVSDEVRDREIKRIKAQATKKRRSPDDRSFQVAGYLLVFTTLSREEATAEEVLELFRFRWQIEIMFKRMKGLLGLGNIRGCTDQTCQVYLLSKVLGALLLEKLAETASAFSPWGYRIGGCMPVEAVGSITGGSHTGNTADIISGPGAGGPELASALLP